MAKRKKKNIEMSQDDGFVYLLSIEILHESPKESDCSCCFAEAQPVRVYEKLEDARLAAEYHGNRKDLEVGMGKGYSIQKMRIHKNYTPLILTFVKKKKTKKQ